MSDCVALLVTLECDYQPGVLFPALVALCWLRTSPIYAGFAVLPLPPLLFLTHGNSWRVGPRSVPRSSSRHVPHQPPDRPTPAPDSDTGAPHVSLDRYHH